MNKSKYPPWNCPMNNIAIRLSIANPFYTFVQIKWNHQGSATLILEDVHLSSLGKLHVYFNDPEFVSMVRDLCNKKFDQMAMISKEIIDWIKSKVFFASVKSDGKSIRHVNLRVIDELVGILIPTDENSLATVTQPWTSNFWKERSTIRNLSNVVLKIKPSKVVYLEGMKKVRYEFGYWNGARISIEDRRPEVLSALTNLDPYAHIKLEQLSNRERQQLALSLQGVFNLSMRFTYWEKQLLVILVTINEKSAQEKPEHELMFKPWLADVSTITDNPNIEVIAFDKQRRPKAGKKATRFRVLAFRHLLM